MSWEYWNLIALSTLTAALAMILADLVIRWYSRYSTTKKTRQYLLIEFDQNRYLLNRSTWQPLVYDAWDVSKHNGVAMKFPEKLRSDLTSFYSLSLHRNNLLLIYQTILPTGLEGIVEGAKTESESLTNVIAGIKPELLTLMDQIDPELKK